ncbi:MAG: hypothetical protein AAF750_02280 [Planctomycetota bacterium]
MEREPLEGKRIAASAMITPLTCGDCGYRLDGLDRSGACPECGLPIAWSVPQQPIDVRDAKAVWRWRSAAVLGWVERWFLAGALLWMAGLGTREWVEVPGLNRVGPFWADWQVLSIGGLVVMSSVLRVVAVRLYSRDLRGGRWRREARLDWAAAWGVLLGQWGLVVMLIGRAMAWWGSDALPSILELVLVTGIVILLALLAGWSGKAMMARLDTQLKGWQKDEDSETAHARVLQGVDTARMLGGLLSLLAVPMLYVFLQLTGPGVMMAIVGFPLGLAQLASGPLLWWVTRRGVEVGVRYGGS